MSVVLVGLVAVTVYDVVMRYAVNRPILWGKDIETMMYGALFVLCAAYCLQVGAHVRVDLLPKRFLSPRGQEITMLVCYLLFFLPFAVVASIYGWDFFMKSFAIRERVFSPWLPPAYPLKFTIPLAASMLLLQGFAEIIRHFIRVIKGHES